MTMNWILSLSNHRAVNNITLYINDDFATEEVLDFWGVDVKLVFIGDSDSFSNEHDVVIWQTYHKYDHDRFWNKYKKGNYLKAKNFPRFLTGNKNVDENRLKKAKANFDLVMFSLEEDYEKSQYLDEFSSQVCHVPRCFPAKQLYKSTRHDDNMVVSIDVRKGGGSVKNSDFDVFFHAKKMLGTKGEKIVFQALGKDLDGAKKIERCSVEKFYRNFINTADVYAFVDTTERFSDAHQNSGGKSTYCGIYENTVVESQLAGLLVIAPDKIVPSELIMNGYNGVRLADDSCAKNMAEALEYCLDNYKKLSSQVMLKRRKKNALPVMASSFLNNVRALLNG